MAVWRSGGVCDAQVRMAWIMVSFVSLSFSDRLFVHLVDSFSMDKAQGFQAVRGDCSRSRANEIIQAARGLVRGCPMSLYACNLKG